MLAPNALWIDSKRDMAESRDDLAWICARAGVDS